MSRISKYTLLVTLMILCGDAFGQPRPPDPDAPITGIEYLIGLGGLLGIKKIMKSFKKTPE